MARRSKPGGEVDLHLLRLGLNLWLWSAVHLNGGHSKRIFDALAMRGGTPVTAQWNFLAQFGPAVYR
jgi:hypothetical protein